MKCLVCSREFELLKENRYLVTKLNLKEIKENKILANVFDAFDCPYCGCQNIVNSRYANVDRILGK